MKNIYKKATSNGCKKKRTIQDLNSDIKLTIEYEYI